MLKRVLSIGNCYLDQTELSRLLRDSFGAETVGVAHWEEAKDALQRGKFDLVLVNRRIHGDTTEGIEIIDRMKSDPLLARIPVMLLSNHPEYQRTAIAAGAEPGFGKAELDRQETREKLGRFLDRRAE